jgi:hypothetical protein
MSILPRLRAGSLAAITIATLSVITSCNALDMSGLSEVYSSELKSIGVASEGIVEVGDTIRLGAWGGVSGLIGILAYDPVLDASWTVSNSLIARLETLPPPPPEDSFPHARVLVRGLQPGRVTVFANARGISGSGEVRVIQRIDHIDVRTLRDTLFVGDTVPIITTVVGNDGSPITDVPLKFEMSNGVELSTYTGAPRVAAIASGPATVTARFRSTAGTLKLTVLAR